MGCYRTFASLSKDSENLIQLKAIWLNTSYGYSILMTAQTKFHFSLYPITVPEERYLVEYIPVDTL